MAKGEGLRQTLELGLIPTVEGETFQSLVEKILLSP
jgi:hypothetical protein